MLKLEVPFSVLQFVLYLNLPNEYHNLSLHKAEYILFIRRKLNSAKGKLEKATLSFWRLKRLRVYAPFFNIGMLFGKN